MYTLSILDEEGIMEDSIAVIGIPVNAILELVGINNMSRCIRCGKERIAASSHKEMVGNSVVIYTITICPDPECQKIVDSDLKKEELKRAFINQANKEREVQRIALKSGARG